ncbi:MAG: ChaN family lipoprotein [Rhizobiaceae bacterium]
MHTLKEQVWKANYVLLGESHDNPDHHKLQANLLAQRGFAGWKSSVIFEMIPRSYSDVATTNHASYFFNGDKNLEDYAKRLDWEKRGWYSWDIYRPIALTATRMRMSIVAGNLDREVIKAISERGFTALEVGQRKRFGLEHVFPAEFQENLAVELKDSHCDLIPDSAIPAMSNVQRAVDGSMADAMIAADNGQGAVLIAGNGHVRKDRGVPFVLRTLVPEAVVVSVGLIEVSLDANEYSDYPLSNDDGTPLYDFVIFTPKFDLTDRCAQLRKKFSKDNDQEKQD